MLGVNGSDHNNNWASLPLALLAIGWNFMNGVVIDWNAINVIASITVAIAATIGWGIRSWTDYKRHQREDRRFNNEFPSSVDSAASKPVINKDDSVLGRSMNFVRRKVNRRSNDR